MNKTWLIVQREYFSRVRKKSFLLTTILVPLVIIGFYAAIIAISVSDDSETLKVAVLDEANLFNNNIQKSKNDAVAYDLVQSETEQGLSQNTNPPVTLVSCMFQKSILKNLSASGYTVNLP